MAFFKNVLDPLGLTTDDDMGTTFIMSGTSVIGHRVASGMLEAGYKDIRVGIWKGERQLGVDRGIGETVLQELEKKGATVITFDYNKEEQWGMALSGVKSVLCTLPNIPGSVETFKNFVKACRHAKVAHFVKVSFFDNPAYYAGVTRVRYLRDCDEVVMKQPPMENRMTYTILGAAHLMSTPLIYQGDLLRKENKYITASYAMGVDYVSPNDIAKAAVVSLVNRKQHRDKVYHLSGYMITDKNVASWLSKFYHKEIEHIAIGYHEIEEEWKKRGFKEFLVKDLACFERVKASGEDEKGSNYTDDLEKITGKKPERFKEYLHDKASMTLQENPGRAEV
jgi:hypothetical protein